jgi:hypothetical protein
LHRKVASVTPSKPEEQVIRLSDLVALVGQLTTIASHRSEELNSIEVKRVDGPGRAIFVTEELMQALRPQQEVPLV